MWRSPWWALVVSAAVLALVCWPVVWERGRDSFPLSSYPMFARKEVKPVVRLTYAIGVDERGERHAIGPAHVANSEVLQARAALSAAVAGGPERTLALCRRIAESIAGDDELAGVSEVRIVTGTHDAVAYLRGDTEGQERLRARCQTGAAGLSPEAR